MENSTKYAQSCPAATTKLSTATLRPVTVERLNRKAPSRSPRPAIKKAEKTFKGFHTVYSTLYVMVALPEDRPTRSSRQIWASPHAARMSEKVILTVITSTSDGSESTSRPRTSRPAGAGNGRRRPRIRNRRNADNDDVFDIDPNGFDQGTPYNNTNHL